MADVAIADAGELRAPGNGLRIERRESRRISRRNRGMPREQHESRYSERNCASEAKEKVSRPHVRIRSGTQ
jgi:hypothetical protein